MEKTEPLRVSAPAAVIATSNFDGSRWALIVLASLSGAAVGIVIGGILGVLSGLIPFIC
ncbi:hypothetical protein [Rubrivivax gelatinosus]|nr:hypothetical protein [Rubrivivax gelatinosus]